MSNVKSPKIRFKGFTNDWEQRKLGEVAKITMGQSPDGSTYSDTPSDYILVQGNADLKNGWVSPRIWTTQKTKTADAGDLIMSVRAPAGAMGKTAYDVVLGRGVAGIKGNEFLYQTLVKMDESGYWKKLAAGSTFESINTDSVVNAQIFMPQDIVEQEKIGSLFLNLDNLITLHQRKYEKLQNIKQAMIEKMFPKNGENFPEIRFKGFTDAWEQRKLGNVLTDLYNGQTPSRSKEEYWNGDINWLSSGELNRGIVKTSIEKITKLGQKSANLRLVPKGTFVMAITGLEAAGTRGNCAILGLDTTLNQSCMALFPNESLLDTFFLFQWYKKVGEEYGIRFTQGTKQQSYNAELIKDLVITLPKINEQKRIAKFLFGLDDLVTLHQRKYEKLIKIKKSFLQKIFI